MDTRQVPPVRNVSRDLWDFLLEEQLRRKKAGEPSRTGDLLNEALKTWREKLDPTAHVRQDLMHTA